ncbi:MAG TPA: peptidylprolyl isomerase [Chthoniobacterales bacterium]|nr:peptidylprolyl isomerase [Chthoniobacterales bacterium]
MFRTSLITFGAAAVALPLSTFGQTQPQKPRHAGEPQVVDGIAAVVSLPDPTGKVATTTDVITYSQVRSLVAPREKVLRSQLQGEELVKAVKEAREAALKDLIDRQLIIQAFKKENYQIPDFFVNQRMHEIIQENFGGDRNTFIKTLEAQNYTEGEFKKLESERMIVQAMRSKNVKKQQIVSPIKIEEYYRTHRDEFTAKEQIKLRMIMIPAKANDSTASSQRDMAEEILKKLANGGEFDRIAQIYSEDSSRDLGGDWGWIERKTLAPPLEKVAFNLPVGKISNIVEYSGNFYILKVEEKKGGTTRSLADARDEIEKKILQQQAQELQERWIASLRSKAYIRTF